MSTAKTARSARLGLRATPEEETVLRRAVDVAHKSLTDFILDAADQAAENTLLDQDSSWCPLDNTMRSWTCWTDQKLTILDWPAYYRGHRYGPINEPIGTQGAECRSSVGRF